MGAAETVYTGVDVEDHGTPSLSVNSSARRKQSTIAEYKHQSRSFARRITSFFPNRSRSTSTRQQWRDDTKYVRSKVLEAYEDFRAFQWLGLLRFVLIRITPILGVSALLAIFVIILVRNFFASDGACRPDGTFDAGYLSYNPWNLNGIFQITLAFGELSFSTVKIIDVIWDVIVGRGGQAILATISYQVFTKALVRSMESCSVSYGTFEAITLQNGTCSAITILLRDLIAHKRKRDIVIFSWMIVSSIFVLAFPTLISAMSGYTPSLQPYIEVKTGSMIPFSQFNLVTYVIHDGSRLGHSFKDGYQVVQKMSSGAPDPSIMSTDSSDWGGEGCMDYTPSDATSDEEANDPNSSSGDYASDLDFGWPSTYKQVGDKCLTLWHFSRYVSQYGFLGLNEMNSTFNNSGQIINLDPPSLNISAHFALAEFNVEEDEDGAHPWTKAPWGYYWKNPLTNQSTFGKVDPTWSNGDFTYNLDEIRGVGRCRQENSNYQWGFSFLMLFITVLLFNIWAIGMYILYLDAFFHSRFDNSNRKMGLKRAVIDLASAMRKDMGEEATEILSNSELKVLTNRALNGGKMSYEMFDESKLSLSRATELRIWWRYTLGDKGEWARDEWFWLMNLAVSLTLLIISCVVVQSLPFLGTMVMFLASILGIYLGRKSRSRWTVPLFAVVVLLASIPFGPYRVEFGTFVVGLQNSASGYY